MLNKLRILLSILLMLSFLPSIFAQGFFQRLGRAVLGVATGAAESYVGSTLNDQDRQAWNDISNDINNGLGLNNGYVNAGNKIQEGETRNAVVEMGVTAASNSGNRTLITVSNTVKAQNDYVNNVSSGMDQKTAQDVAAKQISNVWLDDMEERERVANERKKEEYSVSRNETFNSPSRTGYNEVSSASTTGDRGQNVRADTKSNIQPTLNDMFTECRTQIGEYKQLINSGISSEFLQYKKENVIIMYQNITEEYQKQVQEYQQLIDSGISSEFLQYREDMLKNMYQGIEELKQSTEELFRTKQ